MSFYEQLEKLCLKHNVKPSTIVEQLGMSKGTMSNWKKGGIPNGEAVVRFAKHFHVSTDYLLLGNDSECSVVSIDSAISDEDKEWLSLIHQLPPEAQYEFRGELKGYLKCFNKDSLAGDETLKKTGTTNSAK